MATPGESFRTNQEFTPNTDIDIDLIAVLAGDRPPSGAEKKKIQTLKKHYGEDLYRSVIYILMHKVTASGREARQLFEDIRRHKDDLAEQLGRMVTVQVAALDFLQSRQQGLVRPTIIEEDIVRGMRQGGPEEYERDQFLEELRREVERVRRYGTLFGIIVIDIDDYSSLVGRFGSVVGEAAVKAVGDLLRKNTRLVDRIFRIGKDEFALILPNLDLQASGKAGDKLVRTMHGARFGEKKDLRLSASAGAMSFSEQTVKDVGRILDMADALLGEIKEAGKERQVKLLKHDGAEGTIFDFIEKRAEAPKEITSRFVLHGTPVAPGVAEGKAYIYRDILTDEIKQYAIQETEIERELARMQGAIKRVRKDIGVMERQVRTNLGKEFADIFTAHRAILDDIYLLNELEERLRHERVNAEHIVKHVFGRFGSRLSASDNQVMQERTLDIADLARRILRQLQGSNKDIFARLPKNRVLVAKQLLPSESVHLKRGNVRAIITEKGSATSHAAILARGLGIPYISETDASIDRIPPDVPVVVDADRGDIVVNPRRKEQEEVQMRAEQEHQHEVELRDKVRNLPLEKDGRVYRVLANANAKETIQQAVDFGADGIGLYRIEQIYLQSAVLPTEEQLERILDDSFEPAAGKEITVRLLDIGADKALPYLNLRTDPYSFLGLRGIRVLLRYPRMLDTQLLALLKLSARHSLRILIPVVTLTDEINEVRMRLQRCKEILDKNNTPYDKDIQLGPMIEVPAAVLKIDEILAVSDFVSIGTNDLIQYTMASAREDANLAKYYAAGSDIVLQLIEQVIAHARARKVDCTLCGELAGQTDYTAKLLALGLEHYSVNPTLIPAVKNAIARILNITPAVQKEVSVTS